ncbi:MAG: hypothetical protein QM775_30455 [Pirellulales bacterium]
MTQAADETKQDETAKQVKQPTVVALADDDIPPRRAEPRKNRRAVTNRAAKK